MHSAQNQHNYQESWINYLLQFLLQLLFWIRLSPWWCFGASVMRLVTDPRVDREKRAAFPPTAVCGISDNKPLLEGCGILSSWNISASSCKRYMCPQLACCLLHTDVGPTVIHTSQHSRALSTLGHSFISLVWLLFSFFLFYFCFSFFLFLSFLAALLFSLKAFWPHCTTRNLILKYPVSSCQQEIWEWEKMRKKNRQRRARVR